VHSGVCVSRLLVFWKVDGMVTAFGLYHKHLPYVFKDKTISHVK